jgi:hypothetical protein
MILGCCLTLDLHRDLQAESLINRSVHRSCRACRRVPSVSDVLLATAYARSVAALLLRAAGFLLCSPTTLRSSRCAPRTTATRRRACSLCRRRQPARTLPIGTPSDTIYCCVQASAPAGLSTCSGTDVSCSRSSRMWLIVSFSHRASFTSPPSSAEPRIATRALWGTPPTYGSVGHVERRFFALRRRVCSNPQVCVATIHHQHHRPQRCIHQQGRSLRLSMPAPGACNTAPQARSAESDAGTPQQPVLIPARVAYPMLGILVLGIPLA